MARRGTQKRTQPSAKPVKCGIIMPISPMEDCSESHWRDVRAIIESAVSSISDPAFSVSLVSDGLDTGVIHKRIVENVYQSDIIVCDVSCKNANVMFELGLRIAFDKSVVIIKDDKTDRAFDTGTIETLSYPRSLRYNEIVLFKGQLAQKILNTYHASLASDYQSILRSFGAFEVAAVEQKEVPPSALALREIQDQLTSLSWTLNSMRLSSSGVANSGGSLYGLLGTQLGYAFPDSSPGSFGGSLTSLLDNTHDPGEPIQPLKRINLGPAKNLVEPPEGSDT